MAQPIADPFILGGRGRNLYRNQWEAVLFSAAERATYCATNRRPLYSRRPSAQPKEQPIVGRCILGGRRRRRRRRRDNRHHYETQSGREHTDGAQTGWTSKCVRGYARFMLAVWAGGGAQAASCLVIFLRVLRDSCLLGRSWGHLRPSWSVAKPKRRERQNRSKT